jgi:hypothetical protein
LIDTAAQPDTIDASYFFGLTRCLHK